MASNLIDRVWSVRDAVLRWMYVKTIVDGDQHPPLDAASIATTVNWQSGPLTQREVEQGADWLIHQGYLHGGSGGGRASITPSGESLADAGRSVRDDDLAADDRAVTPMHTDSFALTIDSPDGTQNSVVTDQVLRALAFADALEAACYCQPAGGQARQLASDIQAEAKQPRPDSGRLKHLLASAIAAGSIVFDRAAAADLAYLASQALQTF